MFFNFFKDKKVVGDETMPARCTRTKQEFDIIMKRQNGRLTLLEGKKTVGSCASFAGAVRTSDYKENVKSIVVEGGIYTEKTYRCPICGNKDIVRCGKCHNITCYDGSGSFTCAYCGNSGRVSGVMDQVPIRDNSLKKDFVSGDKTGAKYGDKAYYPGDKPYYPGDK